MRDLARAPIGTVHKRLGGAWLIAVCLAAGNWSVAGFFFVGHRVPFGPSPRSVTLEGLPAQVIYRHKAEIEVEARVPFPVEGRELEITYRLTEPQALGTSSSSALRVPGRLARGGAGARAR